MGRGIVAHGHGEAIHLPWHLLAGRIFAGHLREGLFPPLKCRDERDDENFIATCASIRRGSAGLAV